MATAVRWLNSSGSWVASDSYLYDKTNGETSDGIKNRIYIKFIAYDDRTLQVKIHNNASNISGSGFTSVWTYGNIVLRQGTTSSGTQLQRVEWERTTGGVGDLTRDISSSGTSFYMSWDSTSAGEQHLTHYIFYGPSNTGSKTVTFASPFYTISYNPNGGSGAPGSQTAFYGNNTLSGTAPTRSGYEFRGWATSQARANAGTVDYTAGQTVSITANLSLYAVWKGLSSTIASASSSVQTTNAFSMTVNSFNSSYYQKVRFTINGTQIAETSAFQNSLSYTVPRSWFNNYGTSASLTVRATLYTYTNSSATTQVGTTDYRDFTVTPDSGMKPSLASGAVSLAPYNTSTGAASITPASYIQGFSKVRATVDTSKITFGAGASYKTVSIKVENVTTTGSNTGTSVNSTNTLTGKGTIAVSYTITDSRGLTATGSANITALEYAAPVITILRCKRTDGQMVQDDAGGYFTCKVLASYAAVGNNAVTLTVCWKAADGSYNAATSFPANTDTLRGGALDPDVTYTVLFRATDTLGTVTELTSSLPARMWPFHMIKDGAGFGDVQLEHKKVKLPADWQLEHGSTDLSDSGWQYPILEPEFTQYTAGDNGRVRYGKVGGMVHIRGIVKPTEAIAGGTATHRIFTLPQGYRPEQNVVVVCQGSTRAIWILQITVNGYVYFSRYRDETGWLEAGTSSWLPFSATFIPA